MNEEDIKFPSEIDKEEYVNSDKFLIKNWKQIYNYLDVDVDNDVQHDVSFSEEERKFTAVIGNPENMYLWITEDEEKKKQWEVRRMTLKEPLQKSIKNSKLDEGIRAWYSMITLKRMEVVYVVGRNKKQ